MKMHQKLNDLVESWKKAGDKTDFGKKEGLPSIDYWKTVNGQNIGFIKNIEIGVGGHIGKASVKNRGYPITGNPAIRAKLLGSTDQYKVDPRTSPNAATVQFMTKDYDKGMAAAFDSVDKDPESMKMSEYNDAIAKSKVRASAEIDKVLTSIGKTMADFDDAMNAMDGLGEYFMFHPISKQNMVKSVLKLSSLDGGNLLTAESRINEIDNLINNDTTGDKKSIELAKSIFLVNRVMHLVTKNLMKENISEMQKRGVETFDASNKHVEELNSVSEINAYGISVSLPSKTTNRTRIVMSAVTSLMSRNTAEINGGGSESVKRVKKIMSKNKTAVVDALRRISKEYQAIVSDKDNPDANEAIVLNVSPMAGNNKIFSVTEHGHKFCSDSLGKAIMGSAYDGRVLPTVLGGWGSMKEKDSVKSANFVDADNSPIGVSQLPRSTHTIFEKLTDYGAGPDGRFDGFFDKKNKYTGHYGTANRNMIAALCRRLVKDGVFTDKDAKALLKEAAILETTKNNNVKLDFAGPNRAMYHSGKSAVMLSDLSTDSRTLFHEFGHFVEDNNPRLKSASARFLQKKTAGEPSQPLQKLFRNSDYNVNEISHSDRMPDSYTLKGYSCAGTLDNTEVTSVGCECLSSSAKMTAIYRDNRDLFHHVIGMATGAFMKK